MNQNQMSQIIDGVYFQKLSLLLGNLQTWEKRKDQAFQSIYGKTISRKLAVLEKNEKEIKNELLQFIKILNLQYSFLSRLKKEEKEVEVSIAYPRFQRFAQNFDEVKGALVEIGEYLGKFIGVTNYEYTEIRKVYDEAEQVKHRYEHQKSKWLHTYNQKKELMYSKKNMKKHFELARYLELVSTVDKERKIYEETYLKVHNILIKDMDIRLRMTKDIRDNLEYITKLYSKGIKEQMLSEIRDFYSQKYQTTLQERNSFKENQQNFTFDEDLYLQIKTQFHQYFNSFLQQIAVAQWKVSIYTVLENSQENTKKEKAQMIITFDNKILLYKAESKQIELQKTIEEVKVYHPNNQGLFQIKDKKSKQKYGIEFERIEKEDEFFLHVEKMTMLT